MAGWPEGTVLHLVRHGQSTWNVEGRAQGQTSHVPLTPAGHAQARAAANALRRSGATQIFTSDLRRAQETATPIAAALGLVPTLEPALREQHLGRLQGLMLDQLPTRSTSPGRQHPDRRWDGGESVFDVAERISRFLDRLADSAPTAPVVLVTHGDVIPVVVSCVKGGPARGVEWFDTPNGSVTTVFCAGAPPEVRYPG